jgi:DNA processing protein
MTLRDLVAFSLSCSSPLKKACALSALTEGVTEAPTDALECLLDLVEARESVAALRVQSEELLTRGEAAGLSAVGLDDPRYPPRLRTLGDPPVVLWIAGATDVLKARSVAVVGSRAASAYGLEVAERLGHDLAAAGVTVVSGLARGCDGAAHRGAMDARGSTVAVVGCGADVCYPAEHAALRLDIVRTGAVVSELPPGTPPLPHHFPLRNRLISGLSHAVIVVEASDKSGSLITANCALHQGREVMAVPGNVLGSRHRGSHALLRDGAQLVETAADILAALGWDHAPTAGSADTTGQGGPDLLDWLTPGEPTDLDCLVLRTGRPASDVLSSLMQLELTGVVRRAPGGGFLRTSRQVV